MSWLGSFGVLPSPNHVLAKLAIFRGAEHSPHSPRATDSAAVFYYYFKPFAAAAAAAAAAAPPPPRRRRRRRRRPLSPTEPLSFAGFIPSALSLPPPPPGALRDPASFSRHLPEPDHRQPPFRTPSAASPPLLPSSRPVPSSPLRAFGRR